ncbi:neuronal acetylcholine receptor subunit alpha-10-like [Ptychodera flava]|uniref:neuronal acetylcholine receptor subunit alpha-10-like n=1 Tax=Ptychodera flava TaxID=63121 RepID=UPI00396A25A1
MKSAATLIKFEVLLSFLSIFATGYERPLHVTGKLASDLMTNYSKNIRPVYNVSTVTIVTHGIAISQILEMDELNQYFSLNVWLRQKWQDEFLVWNASEYDDTATIRLPSTSVWRPDMRLYNNVDEEFARVDDTNAIISSNGSITWNAPAIFKASCRIDVLNFPFDTQKCKMKFGSWSYDGYGIDLASDFGEADLSNFMSNGEWDLLSAKAKRNVIYYKCCQEPYPDLTYTVVMKRRPLFYIINIILPNIFIAMLTLVGFYLPAESGEKITLMMTNLLSLIVFQQIVNATMPPTSDIPYLGQYFMGMIVMVALSVFSTVFVLNIFHREAREIPQCMRQFIFGFLAPAVCLGNKRKTHGLQAHQGADELREFSVDENLDTNKINFINMALKRTEEEETHGRVVDNGNGLVLENWTTVRERQESRLTEARPMQQYRSKDEQLDKILQSVQFLAARMRSKDRKYRNAWEWQDMSKVIDRALMWTFVIYTISFSIIMILKTVGILP